jgi:hypothetical protein
VQSKRPQPVHLACSRSQEQRRTRSGSAPEPELRSSSGSAELSAELVQLSSEVCTQKRHAARRSMQKPHALHPAWGFQVGRAPQERAPRSIM